MYYFAREDTPKFSCFTPAVSGSSLRKATILELDFLIDNLLDEKYN
jgi:hypothetical protein